MSDGESGAAILGYNPRIPQGTLSSFPDWDDCFDLEGYAHCVVIYRVEMEGIAAIPHDRLFVPALGIARENVKGEKRDLNSFRFYPYLMCTSAHPLIMEANLVQVKCNVISPEGHEVYDEPKPYENREPRLDNGAVFPEGIVLPRWMAMPVSALYVHEWTEKINQLSRHSHRLFGHYDQDEMYRQCVEEVISNAQVAMVLDGSQDEYWIQIQKDAEIEVDDELDFRAGMLYYYMLFTESRGTSKSDPVHEVIAATWVNLFEQFSQAERAWVSTGLVQKNSDWETLPEVNEFQSWVEDEDHQVHHASSDNGCEKCLLLFVAMRTGMTSPHWEPSEMAAAMSPPQEATVSDGGPPREDLILT